MLVRGLEVRHLLLVAFGHRVVDAGGVHEGRHGHEHVAELVRVHIGSGRPGELVTARHRGLNGLDGQEGRALDGAAATELDDLSTALDGVVLDSIDALLGQAHARDRGAADGGLGHEHRHGLAVTAVGEGVLHVRLADTELLRQVGLQARAVEGGQGGHPARAETGVDEDGERGDVSRVEDDHHVLDFRAVLADIVAEAGGDFAVALQQVFTGHTFLTGSTAGGDDVLRAGEGFLRVRRGDETHARESAVLHLEEDAVVTGLVDIVKADIRCQAQHGRDLGHVGADHTAGTDDEKFFIRKKITSSHMTSFVLEIVCKDTNKFISFYKKRLSLRS